MEVVLPEIVAVGIYNSQMAVKNKSVTNNRKTTMFEIEIPIEDGGVSSINSEEKPIRQNMIICAKPGQIRHTRLPYKCYYVHMILNGGLLFDMIMDTPNFIDTSKSEEYIRLYKRMCRYFESGLDDDVVMLQSLVLELVYSVCKESKRLSVRQNTKRSNYQTIEAAIGYIKNNLTADLSLEAMSEIAGFSPIHFHNCFKASTGKTLHEYVEEQRIKRAQNMLTTTGYTLTRIAYECGFSSQSYFSYAFKRRMNVTPREYAENIFKRYETEISE